MPEESGTYFVSKVVEVSHMDGQDLTKGNIKQELWSLAWPMMLSVFFYTLYNIVDAYWVGKISPEAIAAVSISQITLFVMVSLGFGVTAGSGVIMSMHIGAKNIPAAERILGQSFVLSAILAAVFTVIALVWRNPLLILSGAGGAIFEPALSYYTIIAGGSVLLFLMMAVMFAFNMQGDTHGLTKLFALSTALNAILDPIMIFGWLGFPEMGIAGAAWATLISQAVFLAVALRSLQKPHRMVRFRFSALSFKWASVKKVLDIGFPAALTQVIFPVGLALLTFIVSKAFAEAGAVAFSLGFRIEFFAYLPAVGFGFAGMAMIGQSVGAGNKERAREVFGAALKYASISAAALGVVAAIFAHPIISAFTKDVAVFGYAQTYMWSVALVSYGFLAALLVVAQAFQAIGRSWPGFWLFVLRVGVLTIPLAFLSTRVFDFPILGVWIAVIIGNIVSAVVGYFWIHRALRGLDLSHVPVHPMGH